MGKGTTMIGEIRRWHRKAAAFLRAPFRRDMRGNVAMMFGLSLIPITIAAGAGVDLARAMAVKSSMADALDAAALAVGATPNISQSAAQALAQQYFDANFKADSSADTVPSINVSISGQSVTITASDSMPTTVLKAADALLHSSSMDAIDVSASTTVVWGQTKLWVALVLDNTGSMNQTDSTGTSKISALKTASHSLLTTLQNASANPGDVEASIVPFAKLVKVGTADVSATWIDWTDWEAQPVDQYGNSVVPSSSVGPGSSCPWSSSSTGFRCVTAPGSSTTTSTIPSSGTYAGYICPGVMQAYNASTGSGGHYFNGCYNSAAINPQTSTNTVCSGHSWCSCNGYSNCTCTGSGSNKVCTQTVTTTSGYTHTWIPNSHSLWNGCIEDRTQSYDTTNDVPSTSVTGTLFPAANDVNCPVTTDLGLTYDWTALSNEVDAMVANGSTNQTIGLDHGWQTLTPGSAYGTPSLPANTSQYIILVSDGLNTQDRWYGDGSSQATGVDNRMSLACTNAKAAGIVIYTIFVDLGGTQGNSTVLQNCATDSSKYFDLTTSGSIITTFSNIAQQITNLRVSH